MKSKNILSDLVEFAAISKKYTDTRSKITKTTSKFGVTAFECLILFALEACPSDTKDVKKHTGVAESVTRRMFVTLRTKGLVKRIGTKTALTDKGQELLNSLEDSYDKE